MSLFWGEGWPPFLVSGLKGALLALSDLEHVIALATSPRCLGRPRHVQLLLLLGDVGKHRTKALVLDDGSLIDLRPLASCCRRDWPPRDRDCICNVRPTSGRCSARWHWRADQFA